MYTGALVWSTLLCLYPQTIHDPQEEKQQYHGIDVECCFGVLQSKWGFIQNPSRQWELNIIKNILMTYVSMHNMFIKDERDKEMEPIIAQLNHVSWRHEPMRHGLNFEDYVDGHDMI